MKFRNLQALRAIASLMVVVDHLPRDEGKLFPHGLLAGTGAAGALGVDLFFVISGFIMVVTTRDAFGRPGAARTFLERRVLRIYPPYWLALFAFVIAGTILPSLEHVGPTNLWTIVASMLLLPHVPGPLIFVAWSLQFEMYFYFVFTFALRFGREHLRTIVAAWIAVTLACNVAKLFFDNPVLGVIGSPLTFEFIVGMGIGTLVLRRIRIAPAALLASGVALLCIVAVASARFDGFASHTLEWYRVLAATPAMALIVYGACSLEERTGASVPPLLVRLGDASYTTYLWHGMILGAFTFAAGKVHPHGVAADVAFDLGALAAVVAGALVIYRVVEEPLLALFVRAGAGAPRRRLEKAQTAE